MQFEWVPKLIVINRMNNRSAAINLQLRKKNSTPPVKCFAFTPSAKMHGMQNKLNTSIHALKMIFISIEMSICIYCSRKKIGSNTLCMWDKERELKLIFIKSVLPRQFYDRYGVQNMCVCDNVSYLDQARILSSSTLFSFGSFSFRSLHIESNECDICAKETVIRWDTTDYLTIIYVSSYLSDHTLSFF